MRSPRWFRSDFSKVRTCRSIETLWRLSLGKPSGLSVQRCSIRCSHRITFFFQAEDGIRYLIVTGVQTCALPIYHFFFQAEDGIRDVAVTGVQTCALPICVMLLVWVLPKIYQNE